MLKTSFTSIIVCTYNRAQLLKRLLISLSSQTMKTEQFEIIVVNDGSTDDTVKVCEEMIDTMPNLKCFHEDINIGLQNVQNIGIKEAFGEYLLFTDDDCIAAEDWTETLSAALEKEFVVAGAIDTVTSDFVKLCQNIATVHSSMPGRKAGTIDFIAGANMAIRRSFLEESGGFRTELACSWDMNVALSARSRGYDIYFEPGAVVIHDPASPGIKTIFKYAVDHAAVTINLRNEFKVLLNTPFFFSSPAMILAASPIIAFKVTAGIYLKNVRLLKYFYTIPVVFVLKLAWCWGAARGLRNKKAEINNKTGRQ